MKKIISVVLFISMLLSLTACGTKELSASKLMKKSIPFEAHYIRTNYTDGEKYPQTLWIANRRELINYLEMYNKKYDLIHNDNFKEILKKYDNEFFETHDLIFVLVEESSGSITHEVTDVILKSSDKDAFVYSVQPVIKKTVPEVQTCDMAQWHIIIEVSEEYGKLKSDLQDAVIK